MEENKEINENVSDEVTENTENTETVSEKPEETEKKFKLNPEIRGMIGILGVILLIGLIMAGSMGKFEQWFGIDFTASSKITNKIVYVEEGEKNRIRSYDMVTGKTNTILEGEDIKDVAVSYTGKKIAYVGYEGNVSQIYLMNPDGKKSKVITSIEGSKSKPKFSPDGKYISYIANGRLFRADITGANAFSMLPTKQQQQSALNLRDGKLVIKDYVWNMTGEGMLAVVARSDEDERLVIMEDNNGDAHEVPFPDDMKCRFISLSSALDSKSYIAVGVSHGIYIMFVINEPEEHNHNPQTPQDMGVMPVPMGKDPISYAMLLPHGQGFMFSVKPSDKKMPPAVYMLNAEDQSLKLAIPFFCDKFEYLYGDRCLVYNNDADLKLLEKESSEPIEISEKVQSYSITPPKEIKR